MTSTWRPKRSWKRSDKTSVSQKPPPTSSNTSSILPSCRTDSAATPNSAQNFSPSTFQRTSSLLIKSPSMKLLMKMTTMMASSTKLTMTDDYLFILSQQSNKLPNNHDYLCLFCSEFKLNLLPCLCPRPSHSVSWQDFILTTRPVLHDSMA